jgi:RimJ/RimL family protein N-acetyltransferase
MRADRRPHDDDDVTAVQLRGVREDDLGDIVAATADAELRRWMPLLPDPYTIEMARADFARQADDHRQWAAVDATTDRLLGCIQLSADGEIDYWTAPWGRGRGVATTALAVVSEWAFAHGFRRLFLTIHADNEASQRVALRAGFTRDAVVRGARPPRDGDPGDRVRYVKEPS